MGLSAEIENDENTDCLNALKDFFSSQPQIITWGIASTQTPPHAHQLKAWIDKGHHASMEYMASRLTERMAPKNFKPWANSIVLFAFPYARPLNDFRKKSSGTKYRVAAYAGALDYHHTAKNILQSMEHFLKTKLNNPELNFYGFVDTAPVFERDLASEAGIGWRGKNCCTLNRDAGSGFHLAGFFLPQVLPTSKPVDDFCGGCTRCLDQCPTDAFIAPGKLDANKCISYWTIESKSTPPKELRQKFNGWIFGCDICQEVCPWNQKYLREKTEDELFPSDGVAWLNLLQKGGGFQSRFKSSPLNRAGRKGLLRNVAQAAVNLKDKSVVQKLKEILPDEVDVAVIATIKDALAKLDSESLNSI